MSPFLENLFVGIWNRLQKRQHGAWNGERASLNLGFQVVDGRVTRRPVSVSNTHRTMGSFSLGVPGSGKSSSMLYQASQDIDADRGFLFFDPHGDQTPRLLQRINARERRERRHLSHKVILIQPSDPTVSAALNPLKQEADDFVRFVCIAELSEILLLKCGLDHFTVRIEETLRNGLFALSANELTLLELPLLLTNQGFRRTCMRRVQNAEVRQYFETRYDQMSAAMQATIREPVLNKIGSFLSSPHFRHLLGQTHSTFSIRQALDDGSWILVDLPRGELGAHASTLGSLIFTTFRNALFARQKRSIFSCYMDELQNFIGSDVETVVTQGRKFSTPIVSANQTLAQLPVDLRSALLSVGTQLFFRLSPSDAAEVAQALDGGKTLAERLKHLPQRHAIVKRGADRWVEIAVPHVSDPDVDYTDLLNRARYTHGRVRAHIERDIAKRQEGFAQGVDEVLHDWR